MNSAVRLKRAIKFGSGVDARVYEEGVLKPPLPVEIIEEMKVGNPYIELLNKSESSDKAYDYVSEMKVKSPDMSEYKTTGTTVAKTDVGNDDTKYAKTEAQKPKPKLVKRVKLVRRRKKP